MKKILSMLLVTTIIFSVLGVNSVLSGADDILFGDANVDGVVDVKDVLAIRNYSLGIGTVKRDNADVNYDTKVNIKDILLLREYLACKIDTLIPEAYSTTKPDPTYAVTNTYTIDKLANCMYLCGRSVVSGTTLKMDQTAAGMKFKANCEGDIKFNITSNNGGYIDIIVDDNYENIHRVTLQSGSATAEYKQFLSLSQGEHTFEILKATEWQRNRFVLNSVTINGEIAATAPTHKDLKIEFYGDSITAGYGNLCNGGWSKWDWMYQDGCMTYASYCCYELGAEYAVAAAGGYGVLGGFADNTSTYDKFFDYSIISSKTLWNRAEYKADLIVINYGTNDDSRDGANLDSAAFKNKYKEIIEGIHADNPDAPILLIIGMNYIADSKPVVSVLADLANTYDYVSFKKWQSRQEGGDSHPSVANHKEAGHELAQYIKANFLAQ